MRARRASDFMRNKESRALKLELPRGRDSLRSPCSPPRPAVVRYWLPSINPRSRARSPVEMPITALMIHFRLRLRPRRRPDAGSLSVGKKARSICGIPGFAARSICTLANSLARRVLHQVPVMLLDHAERCARDSRYFKRADAVQKRLRDEAMFVVFVARSCAAYTTRRGPEFTSRPGAHYSPQTRTFPNASW